MKSVTTGPPASQDDRSFEQQLRDVNEALIVSSVHQHELTDNAEKAEAIARESEERFRTLFELVPVAVYSCDIAGVIQQFNRRAVELWGREPVLGDPNQRFCGSFKMFHSNGSLLPHDQCPMAEVVSGKIPEVCDAEVVIERLDGSRITAVVNIRPMKNQLGEITGAINCFYDISDRAEFERERAALLANEQVLRMDAEAANRSKDLFLATLSHEVRTPLNAILGWATILRDGRSTASDIQEGLEVIERNCKAQAQLIDDMLDISRIVSGKMQLQICSCELAKIIIAAVDVVRPGADAKGVRLITTFDAADSQVSCDQNRIQQVIWNLLSNAVKFTPAGGTVRITLARENSAAQICVSDEGLGIDSEFLPFVFDRFRQADSSTRRKLGGLGLGLSIVKQLVELHGGTVSVESPGEGHGATFTVNLPFQAIYTGEAEAEVIRRPDKVATAKLAPNRLSGLRVLVVDDEPDVRRLLVKVLGEAGAIVTAVDSVAAALAAVKISHPNVLVSDIAMPVHDGYDLIRHVRATGLTAKDLPAVALTAFAHKEDQRQALLAGFQIHVSKPVNPYDLTGVVASLCGRTG
jgi:PAS domain S-box-containing protein